MTHPPRSHPPVTRFGIRQRVIGLFFLFALLPAAIVGYFGYTSTLQVLRENVLEADRQKVSVLSEQFRDYFVTVRGDLRLIQNFHALHRFLQWRDVGEPYKAERWRETVEDALTSLAESKQVYSRIQVLDPQGWELIHILYNRQSEGTSIEPEQRPTRLDSESYLDELARLRGDELYISPVFRDADRPNSDVPVLRIGAPIRDRNKTLRGNLVFTVRPETLLQNLAQEDALGSAFYYLLVDQGGRYVYHGQRRGLWQGVEQPPSLREDMPGLFQRVEAGESGLIEEFNAMWAFSPIPVDHAGQQRWMLIKQTNADTALQRIDHFRRQFFAVLALAGLLVLFFASWFAHGLVRPLLLINGQLKQLAIGRIPDAQIVYRRQDEIAEILHAVEQVKAGFRDLIEQANTIAGGDYSRNVRLLSSQDQLGLALLGMTQMLREARSRNHNQNWLKNGQNGLNEVMSGDQSLRGLAAEVIGYLTLYLEAQAGVLYLAEEEAGQVVLRRTASYAHTPRADAPDTWPLGYGLIGQVALERRMTVIEDVPDDGLRIRSGVGEAMPNSVLIVPFAFEGQLKGVLEIGSFTPFTALQRDLLEQVIPALGIAVHTAESRSRMEQLLKHTQSQAAKLKQQAAEMAVQEEELREANQELETRARDLQAQHEAIAEKNTELTRMREESEARARELELAYRYKSEFLANMSHELRTPLNSLLILTQLLQQNRQGNILPKQLEYLDTIHNAANELLTLINEILDLSKVEAGKMELQPETLSLAHLAEGIKRKFNPIAAEKGVALTILIDTDAPATIQTDAQRLRQIMNNLLSNAFKFTEQGGVTLKIERALTEELGGLADGIAIRVRDTGIGIAADKLELIFEAFHQADGSTNRKFGGTGLGLSISRQLVELMEGRILVASEPGVGSTFSVILPGALSATAVAESSADIPAVTPPPPVVEAEAPAADPKPSALPPLADDRENLTEDGKTLLVIEDDRDFAQLLIKLGREKGFQCLCAENGRDGLDLAETHQPAAIILDVSLPQVDGWSVMEHLKENVATRHIPVHFIAGSEGDAQARKMGAIGFLLKPANLDQLSEVFQRIEQFINAPLRHVLILSENETHRQTMLDCIDGEQAEPLIAETCEQAFGYLEHPGVDCVVLDRETRDGGALGKLFELLNSEPAYHDIPVIVYAEEALTQAEEARLMRETKGLTVTTAHGPERLLDEATLFLHQVEAKLPREKRGVLRMMHDKEALFQGKQILLADDDMRNVFALATILEEKGMTVEIAKNGQDALDQLAAKPDFDLILMDMMMPEMDGFEAMRQIRQQPQHARLPILALTAKAMQDDKARCIEAGANDYLAKPIDTDKLLSMMRVWLYR